MEWEANVNWRCAENGVESKRLSLFHHNMNLSCSSQWLTLSIWLTKFILHGHDDFHVVKGVQSKVLHEVWLHRQLWTSGISSVKAVIMWLVIPPLVELNVISIIYLSSCPSVFWTNDPATICIKLNPILFLLIYCDVMISKTSDKSVNLGLIPRPGSQWSADPTVHTSHLAWSVNGYLGKPGESKLC